MFEPVLSDQTHAFVRQHEWEVAVLPFGATEPHNLHMPYGTDIFEATAVGATACQFAWDRGAKVLCLPTMPFGVNTSFMRVPGGMTISLLPSTLLKIVADVVDSLVKQGVKKIVLLNGHGGNELKPIVRELYRDDVFLAVCDVFRLAPDLTKDFVPGGHADEYETSLGLALFPDLMHVEAAGPGAEKPCRFEAVRKGWVQIVRPWDRVTADTGLGDPKAASAEKGRMLMEAMGERLGTFLVDLAKAKQDATFPF